MKVLNSFFSTYNTSNSVQQLITELKAALQYAKPDLRQITINESHIYIDSTKATFDMKEVTQIEPAEIEIYSAIEFFSLYKDYLKRYENSNIPGLMPASELKDVEWDYISGWEDEGILKPKHIIKWAYADNGYFSEQDEDLLMYKPKLISIMHELMLDPNSKRKVDLLKILSAYAKQAFGIENNIEAQTEFLKLLKVKSTIMNHTKLIKQILELSQKARC